MTATSMGAVAADVTQTTRVEACKQKCRLLRRCSSPAIFGAGSENEAANPPGTSQENQDYIFLKNLSDDRSFRSASLYQKVKDKSLVVWKERTLACKNEGNAETVEAQLEKLLLVHHANIITYTNFFIDEGLLHLELSYANAGTLHEKIGIQDSLFGEEMVIWYFFQVVSAVGYLHLNGILHRDINTSSIYLTKSGLVKLGDIGILHVTAEEQHDPDGFRSLHNASPEFLAGRQYDVPCDLWALGCVLHELLTLHSPYKGDGDAVIDEETIREAVNNISSRYSKDMRSLLSELINLEPDARPGCSQILSGHLFSTLGEAMETKVNELDRASHSKARTGTVVNSQQPSAVNMSGEKEVLCWGGGIELPAVQELLQGPDNAPIQVSTGSTHYSVLSLKKELYTWSANYEEEDSNSGELGHGDRSGVKGPKKLEALQGIPLKMVSCGNKFTACLTENGTMYTFGSDQYGCLGCNREEGDLVDTPLQVMFFQSKPVERVSCGENHVLALTQEKEVYAWGCGEQGRLGIGSESSIALPTRVPIPGDKVICDVVAGRDNSFFLTEDKLVIACGSNEDNKLGMNFVATGLRKDSSKTVFEVTSKINMALVCPLVKYRVLSLSAGKTHSAAITEGGILLTFGQNKYGQLGTGDFNSRPGICEVKGPLTNKAVEMVACGDGFTVVTTRDHYVYSFGNTSRGRLGADPSSTGRKRSAIPVPRQVFTSPCHVSSLSCSESHTIIIKEEVVKSLTEPDRPESEQGSSLIDRSSCDEKSRSSMPQSPDRFGLSRASPSDDQTSDTRTRDTEDLRRLTDEHSNRDLRHDVTSPLLDGTLVIPPPSIYRDGYSGAHEVCREQVSYKELPSPEMGEQSQQYATSPQSEMNRSPAQIPASYHPARRGSLPHYQQQYLVQPGSVVPHSKGHSFIHEHNNKHGTSYQHQLSKHQGSPHQYFKEHSSVHEPHEHHASSHRRSSLHNKQDISRHHHSKQDNSIHGHSRGHTSGHYSSGHDRTRHRHSIHQLDFRSHLQHNGHQSLSNQKHTSRQHLSDSDVFQSAQLNFDLPPSGIHISARAKIGSLPVPSAHSWRDSYTEEFINDGTRYAGDSIPSFPLEPYPTHNQGEGSGRERGHVPRGHVSDAKMVAILRRNQELELENCELKELVKNLQEKNADLRRKVSGMHVTDEPPADFV